MFTASALHYLHTKVAWHVIQALEAKRSQQMDL